MCHGSKFEPGFSNGPCPVHMACGSLTLNRHSVLIRNCQSRGRTAINSWNLDGWRYMRLMRRERAIAGIPGVGNHSSILTIGFLPPPLPALLGQKLHTVMGDYWRCTILKGRLREVYAGVPVKAGHGCVWRVVCRGGVRPEKTLQDQKSRPYCK